MLLKTFKQLFNKKKIKSSAWDAAGSGRRVMYWQPEKSSINNLLSQSLEHLRSRSRDMVRKNPYATNIIDTIVSNSIGTGIKPQSKARDAEFRKKVQELWLKWTDEADSNGVSDFYGLQALVCRSMIEGGECFVRLRTRKLEDRFSVPLQLQVLESEHLDNKTNQTLGNGNVIRNGIEFNRLGQREAYYLFKEHPGESMFGESVRVPANDVLHIYKPLRPGQIRGEPWLSNILLKLYELDQYDDAELVRKKTAAMFAGFITRLDPEANIMGEGESNEQGVALSGLEPGTMQLLDPGEDIKFSEPSDVGGSYEAFMRQQLRAIAIGTGITYEQLTGDLTGVNYSSIRAGLIEFRRRCAMLQHNIIVFQFCRPVWSRWLELATLSGELSTTDNQIFKDVKWIPQGFDWVDPLKDQQAQQMAVRNGFKSRAEVVSEMGYHPTFKNIKHSIKSNVERTAIIPIHGILTKKPGAFDEMLGMTSYEQIEVQITQALADSSIETIILEIDSPGGEVNGIFDLADFIYKARSKKRIIAMANDDAYSAAYAIASSAEKVFVSRTSGVGSIGVIASHIDQSRFDEKQGIKYTTVFAGSKKNDLNPHEPMTSESLESLQKEVDRLYEMFLQLIARNRGLSIEKIRSTEAGLYFGENAVEIGLADGMTILSSINKNRSITMNEQTITDLETNNLTKYRTEVVELIRLCNLSRMPEKIGEFIEQGVSVEQAREVLMELLAERTKKTEIISTIPQNSGEELMMQVAKSRRHLKYITKGEKQNE